MPRLNPINPVLPIPGTPAPVPTQANPAPVSGTSVANAAANPIPLPNQFSQLPLYTPEQQAALGTLLNQGLANVQAPGPQQGFAPFAQKAKTQFETQIVPSLADRFTRQGGQGALRSSAFQGALGQAGAGLAENLAALESQYELAQQQQRQNLGLQQLGYGLRPSYDYLQESPGFLSNLAGGLGAAAPSAIELITNALQNLRPGSALSATPAALGTAASTAIPAVAGTLGAATPAAIGRAAPAVNALRTGAQALGTAGVVKAAPALTAALAAKAAPASTAATAAGTGLAAKGATAAGWGFLAPLAALGTVIAIPFLAEAIADWWDDSSKKKK